MFIIECSHSTDIGTVCFLSALTPIEIVKNIRQLDLVAANQVVLLNGLLPGGDRRAVGGWLPIAKQSLKPQASRNQPTRSPKRKPEFAL